MGQSEILDKLSKKLSSVPRSEEDMVFILSRIRKYLESESYPEKYSILNFYCNLALHTKIDKVPKELGKEIKRVHDNVSHYHPFFDYQGLHTQLQSFFSEYSLPDFYEFPDFKGIEFLNLLNSIYADTPVIASIVQKYKVIVNKDGTIMGQIIED